MDSQDEDTFVTAPSQPDSQQMARKQIELSLNKSLIMLSEYNKTLSKLERGVSPGILSKDSLGSVTQPEPRVLTKRIRSHVVKALKEIKMSQKALAVYKSLEEEKATEALEALEEHRTLATQRHVTEPEIEELTTALTSVSLTEPDIRLVIAYPRDSSQFLDENTLIPFSRLLNTKKIFGVAQTKEHVDFNLSLPCHNNNINITYDPSSDDCHLIMMKAEASDKVDNSTAIVSIAQLKHLSSATIPAIWKILDFYQDVKLQPGIWRILVSREKADFSTIDILLLRRSFNVSIHETQHIVSAKREATDTLERPAKRLKLGAQRETATSLEPGMIKTSNQDTSQTLQTTATLLDLQDGHTAIIRTQAETPEYCLQKNYKLGKSDAALVFSCQQSTTPGDIIAAKVLRYKSRDIFSLARAWKREKQALEILDHENIVKLRAFDGRLLLLGLESLPPSLYDILNNKEHPSLQLFEALKILQDLSSALTYLSTKNIIHNDIKPQNIAYSSHRGTVLFDFGMACPSSTSSKLIGGSPWYIPPEYLIYQSRGFAGDIWALGITMLYLLGNISFPDTGEGWWIQGLSAKGGDDRQKMHSWLGYIARKREELYRTSKKELLLSSAKVQRLVVKMLHAEAKLRIKAATLNAKAAAIKLV